MNRTLVIGATGTVGGAVVAQLADIGAPVRALVRNPALAQFSPEVETVRGDLTAPESLDAALDGVDAVFLVWVAPAEAFDAALQRIVRHARKLVLLSAPLKTNHPFVQQPNPSRTAAERVERAIESSGIEWTFLRPGMFSANSLRWWAPQIRAGDVVRWPYLDLATAPIDERDIAAVGVRALLEEGHGEAEYVLTGPEPISHAEQIATIARAIGRELRIEEMTPEEARRECLPGYPRYIVNFLLDAWGASAGVPPFMSSTFEEMMGRRARSFGEWVADRAGEFVG